jgi:hypothetical protein
MSFVQTIITDIEKVWDEVKDIGEVVLTDADKVVNMIMAFEQSPTGQEIITGLETVFPAGSEAINAIALALPVIAKDMKWGADELGKSDDQIFQDAWTYLKNTVGSIKANQLNAFASLVGEILNGVKEGTLTIQQLITFAQGAHAPLVVAA